MNYKELSSQEDCSQDSNASRPVLKATRGRVVPNLNESNSEDDDVPDIDETPFKSSWEKTKEDNELVRYEFKIGIKNMYDLELSNFFYNLLSGEMY